MLPEEDRKARNRAYQREYYYRRKARDPERVKANRRRSYRRALERNPDYNRDRYQQSLRQDPDFNKKRYQKRLQANPEYGREREVRRNLENHKEEILELIDFVLERKDTPKEKLVEELLWADFRVRKYIPSTSEGVPQDPDRPRVAKVIDSKRNAPDEFSLDADGALNGGGRVYEMYIKFNGECLYAEPKSEGGRLRLILKSKGEDDETD